MPLGVGKRLCVNSKGDYYPCPGMHGYVFGNARDNTLAEVWKGEKNAFSANKFMATYYRISIVSCNDFILGRGSGRQALLNPALAFPCRKRAFRRFRKLRQADLW